MRQHHLSENRFGRYLVYAVGEILIVLIGILIAIQINNWNEQRKEGKIREYYLDQLLLDFETDKTYYESVISLLKTREDQYKKFLKLFSIPDVDAQTILSGILKLNLGTIAIDFPSSTINILVETGDIKLVPDAIRNKIITYKKKQDITLMTNGTNINGADEILKNISMFVNFNLIKLPPQSQLYKYLRIEENMSRIIIGIDSYFTWRHVAERSTISSFKILKNDADTIIARINKEIEK